MTRTILHLARPLSVSTNAAQPAGPSRTTIGAAQRRLATMTMVATLSVAAAAHLGAQDALGTPFIGRTLLSFQAAQNSRIGNAAQTTTFGAIYGRRFGDNNANARVHLVLRASARALDGVDTGVLDFAATVGISRALAPLPNLSVAASTGAGLMAWNDDAAHTARAQFSLPANAGLSYALKLGGATLSPFVMGTVARYDVRNGLNDVQVSRDTGWDTYYTSGAALRFREVVLSTSVIDGERGMPTRSRWTFAAGVSF